MNMDTTTTTTTTTKSFTSKLLTSLQIFNQNGPGLGIVRGIDVQNKTNHMGLRFVNMHIEVRLVAIETESISEIATQLHSGPGFCVALQIPEHLVKKEKQKRQK
jgi:hypothetical protein